MGGSNIRKDEMVILKPLCNKIHPHNSFWFKSPGILLCAVELDSDPYWGEKNKFVKYTGDDETFQRHVKFYRKQLQEWIDIENKRREEFNTSVKNEKDFKKHLCDIAGSIK